MKLTLLEIVQDVLNILESDEVTSISDTVESEEVAFHARAVLYDLIEQRVIPELFQLTPLTGLADTAHPNYFIIPDAIEEISWTKYNVKLQGDTRDNYQDLIYWDPKTFIDRSWQQDSSDSNIRTITDFGGVTYLVRSNKAPQYWTSFDDLHVVCDSYDSAIDTLYLLGNKTLAYGKKLVVWTMEDMFIPPIDDSLFPLYLNELKAYCFTNMKQQTNQKLEQHARRHLIQMQNDKHRFSGLNSRIGVRGYGRKSYNPSRNWLGRDPRSGWDDNTNY